MCAIECITACNSGHCAHDATVRCPTWVHTLYNARQNACGTYVVRCATCVLRVLRVCVGRAFLHVCISCMRRGGEGANVGDIGMRGSAGL